MRSTKKSSSLYLAISLAVAGIVGESARGSVVWGPIFDSISEENLYVVSPSDWTGAEAEAQELGGNLVTINSAAENQLIVDDVLQDFTSSGGPNLSATPMWIGLYDPDEGDGSGSQHAADFEWADGSVSTYRNWNPGEPNDNDGKEYWTAINWDYARNSSDTPGTWNDTPDEGTVVNLKGPYYGIAEVAVPEPAAAGLLVASLGAMLMRRNRRLAK